MKNENMKKSNKNGKIRNQKNQRKKKKESSKEYHSRRLKTFFFFEKKKNVTNSREAIEAKKIFEPRKKEKRKKKKVWAHFVRWCVAVTSHPQPPLRRGHGCTVGVKGDPHPCDAPIQTSPSSWMDGVFRAVRWVMRGFDAADSERTVRPESPTSPPSTSLHTHVNKPTGRVGRGKKIPHIPERGVNHGQAASG